MNISKLLPVLSLPLVSSFFAATAVAQMERIPGADARIHYSDYVTMERTADDAVGFDRIKDSPGRGFRWSSPGTRVRFRTDAAGVMVHLRYTDRHLKAEVRNGIGFYRIDGKADPEWKFDRPSGGRVPGQAELNLRLPVPEGGGVHDYELILPYADAVEFGGVSATTGANWSAPAARPAIRYVAFGDSVTQGFTASDVTHTYPFIVAEALNWQLINAGFGGRGAMAADGDFLAGIEAGIYSIAIGVNNWQGGTELSVFRTEITGLLQRLRKGRPQARIHVVTPLWVPPTWKPAQAKYPLNDYRAVIKEVVASLDDPAITMVDGPSLIDPETALFDAVAVHPNDTGFAQMAERLVKAMR